MSGDVLERDPFDREPDDRIQILDADGTVVAPALESDLEAETRRSMDRDMRFYRRFDERIETVEGEIDATLEELVDRAEGVDADAGRCSNTRTTTRRRDSRPNASISRSSGPDTVTMRCPITTSVTRPFV